MGNGKLTVCFHTRGGVARWKWETGNRSPTRDVRDQVGNGKWEIGCGFVEQTKWEMGNGKWPSGKLDVLELPAFGKRETGNWLLNLPRRDILKNTVEGFRSIKTEPFEGCENRVCLVLPWETGTGNRKRESVRLRFRCEAEKARPEKPEGSTEGQAGLRARRRAWPSVPIGLVPIIRVVLVGQSREALVTAQRPARGDRLITSSAYRWTMGPGRRSVLPDHRRTPKAAVAWGGSFCFPLMAPLSSQLRPASGRIPVSRFPFPVSQGTT